MTGRRRTLDLSTSVGSVRLRTPVMTASGTAGHGAELAAYGALADLGAVVTKSLSPEPWPGNAAPRVRELAAGMLNSVGLQGPGLAAWLDEDLPALRAAGATVVASIWGRTVEEFEKAASMLAGAAVAAVEVNVSCPNLHDGSRMFAQSPSATAEALDAAAGAGVARWAKLSPTTPDLLEVARAALDAGAEALTLVNTLSGMSIDIERRRPALGAGTGGVSGPALHPVAVRAVFECRAAFPGTPIVGAGGIMDELDAIEMLMAGADAGEVGTAIFRDPRAPWKITEGIVRWCRHHGIRSLDEVRGAAHG